MGLARRQGHNDRELYENGGIRFSHTRRDAAGAPADSAHVLHQIIKTPMDIAIVFRPQPGKLAVLYGAKAATHASLNAAGSPLGTAVDEVLFPLFKG